jgi:phospholipid/cholesterol/gamma-HCH transport system substrate-binding protein
MLQDPEFGKEGLASLKAALKNVEVLTDRLKEGEGFAGRLFFDPAMASKADELTKVISDLSAITGALNRKEGALGDLLEKDGSSEKALEDFKLAAASLRRTAEAFESTDGLIGRLLHDKEFSTQVATNLRETMQNLAEISRKVNSGQGSLGALVNERTLHDGLEDVVTGVNDSRFARWLLRHYQKKGIKATPEPQPPKP